MNNIKKLLIILKKIPIIYILLIISSYIIIKYSELPLFAWIPQGLIKYFLKPEYGTTKYECYRILENLSLAYIASYIFYVLIDYLPKRKNEKLAYISIQSYLIDLYLNMSIVIAALNASINLKTDIKKIKVDDLKSMDELTIADENIFYHKYNYINGILMGNNDGYFNYYSDTPKYIKLIKKEIEKIKSIPCSSYINYNLLLVITNIEINNFLSQILGFEKKSLINNAKVIYSELGVNYFNFISSYIMLEKYVKNKHTYVYELMTDEEKTEYLKTRDEIMKLHNFKEKDLSKNKIYCGGKEI